LFDNGWSDAASVSTDERKRPRISERTIFEKQLMRHALPNQLCFASENAIVKNAIVFPLELCSAAR
jgi:hypothetical protein